MGDKHQNRCLRVDRRFSDQRLFVHAVPGRFAGGQRQSGDMTSRIPGLFRGDRLMGQREQRIVTVETPPNLVAGCRTVDVGDAQIGFRDIVEGLRTQAHDIHKGEIAQALHTNFRVVALRAQHLLAVRRDDLEETSLLCRHGGRGGKGIEERILLRRRHAGNGQQADSGQRAGKASHSVIDHSRSFLLQ
ncbi:MAG: hypothetical protein P1U49_10970 [Minwuia sp.]|nr:hypothetical protein [Minwuia sp.]